MAETRKTPGQDTDPGTRDEPVRGTNDPGGAHRKGYIATPGPERSVPEEGPIPLVPDSEVHEHVHKPDQSQAVQPSE